LLCLRSKASVTFRDCIYYLDQQQQDPQAAKLQGMQPDFKLTGPLQKLTDTHQESYHLPKLKKLKMHRKQSLLSRVFLFRRIVLQT